MKKTAGLECIGVFANAEAALKRVPTNPPHVLLVDLDLPGLSGVECIRRLKDKLPDLPMLVLTKYEDTEHIVAALSAGADGYLFKPMRHDRMPEQLRQAYLGDTPSSPGILRRLAEINGKQKLARDEVSCLSAVSPRENEVVALWAEGKGDKEASDHLDIGLGTIREYRKRIFKKLGVHSRPHAVAIWLRNRSAQR
jgi:DNA-binding NarL/FixJ family response regulator